MATANSLALKDSENLAHINVRDEVLEKVMLNQDLKGLNAKEKIAYMGNLCRTLGLNPYTRPFEIMSFNGKEVPYARKDCTEQLRKINNVSITRLDTKMMDGGIYIVTAYAERAGGIKDSSTGAICITGLKGDALSNAIMKAETKAKRRVTLSICGLGFLDETEVDSIANVDKKNVLEYNENSKKLLEQPNIEVLEDHDIDQDLLDISWSDSVDNLKETYTKAYKFWMHKKHKENMQRCLEAKNKKLSELKSASKSETIDTETGEIK